MCIRDSGGTSQEGENISLDENDPAAVAAFAKDHGCGMVVIGPEAPLVVGVADAVREAGIPCFGPGAEGAQMEGSKLFSKQLMERAGVPTAAYGSFTDEQSALDYVNAQGAPLVVKADGLAAGKGVIVATELEQALDAVHECFSGAFGLSLIHICQNGGNSYGGGYAPAPAPQAAPAPVQAPPAVDVYDEDIPF